MRALIVDNSRVISDLSRDFLNRARFQVVAAAGGLEALALLDTIGPAVVAFVSWDLPGKWALTLVREVRSHASWDAMRIIMVTDGLDTQQVIQGIHAGVDDCLIRPFTRSRLLEKIAALSAARHFKRDFRA